MNIINGSDTQAIVHWGGGGRQIIQNITSKIQRQEILPFYDTKCGNSSVFHKGHV